MNRGVTEAVGVQSRLSVLHVLNLEMPMNELRDPINILPELENDAYSRDIADGGKRSDVFR